DAAVAEVADQQVAPEVAEGGGGQHHPPRRVERPVADQPLEVPGGGVEDVEEAVARPGHVVVCRGVLLGEGDVNLAAEVGDVGGGEALGDGRVGEGADELEVGVEGVDLAVVEVGREEDVLPVQLTEGGTLEDGVGDVGGQDGAGARGRLPGGDVARL